MGLAKSRLKTRHSVNSHADVVRNGELAPFHNGKPAPFKDHRAIMKGTQQFDAIRKCFSLAYQKELNRYVMVHGNADNFSIRSLEVTIYETLPATDRLNAKLNIVIHNCYQCCLSSDGRLLFLWISSFRERGLFCADLMSMDWPSSDEKVQRGIEAGSLQKIAEFPEPEEVFDIQSNANGTRALIGITTDFNGRQRQVLLWDATQGILGEILPYRPYHLSPDSEFIFFSQSTWNEVTKTLQLKVMWGLFGSSEDAFKLLHVDDSQFCTEYDVIGVHFVEPNLGLLIIMTIEGKRDQRRKELRLYSFDPTSFIEGGKSQVFAESLVYPWGTDIWVEIGGRDLAIYEAARKRKRGGQIKLFHLQPGALVQYAKLDNADYDSSGKYWLQRSISGKLQPGRIFYPTSEDLPEPRRDPGDWCASSWIPYHPPVTYKVVQYVPYNQCKIQALACGLHDRLGRDSYVKSLSEDVLKRVRLFL